MRKIKFRAWDGVKYHYRISISEDGKMIDYYCGQCLGTLSYEIEQFTGLYDKNGEEIYEGDILNLLNYYNTQVNVIFFEGSFTISGQFQFIPKMSEVIGNIHEKQELAP